jgi:chitinase
MKLSNILKTGLLLSTLLTAHVSFADFTACPTAAGAQAYFNSTAGKLVGRSNPSTGFIYYTALAADNFMTIDYYARKAPANLSDHVKYLATFLQGDAVSVDLPASAPTVRHCYYPGTATGGTGILDPLGNPLTAQALALEYGPGTPPAPTPPTTTVNVTATIIFPVAPPAAATTTVTLASPTQSFPVTTGLTGTSTTATINGVVVSANGTPYPYNYSAKDVLVGAQNYCATSGTASLSTTNKAFTVTFAACSPPPPPPAGNGNIYGYYTEWSVYGRNFFPNQIPYSTLDVVLYAFEQLGDCGPRNGEPSHDCPVAPGFTGTQDYQLHTIDAWTDYNKPMPPDNTPGVMPDVIKLAHAAGKEVLLSIGGYSLSDPITDLMNDTAIPGCKDNDVQIPASSAAKRAAFITSMWTGPDPMLTNYQFDGVDVDFEPNGNHWGTSSLPVGSCYKPVSPQIVQNYSQFLVNLKAALNLNQPTRNKLTIALTANPTEVAYIASVQCPSSSGTISCLTLIANTVDTINVMSYDYHGAFDVPGLTNFASALYPDDQEPSTVPTKGMFNLAATIQAYQNAGVPMSKIVIGIPTYVRLENGLSGNAPVAGAPGLYMSFMGAPNGEYGDTTGVYDYRCALSILGKFGIAPVPTTYCNASSFAKDYTPYLRLNSSNQLVEGAAYSPTDSIFFSFDGIGDPSINTLTDKINFVKAQGISGVMFWELAGDLNPTDYPLAQYQQYSLIYNANKQLSTATEAKK